MGKITSTKVKLHLDKKWYDCIKTDSPPQVTTRVTMDVFRVAEPMRADEITPLVISIVPYITEVNSGGREGMAGINAMVSTTIPPMRIYPPTESIEVADEIIASPIDEERMTSFCGKV